MAKKKQLPKDSVSHSDMLTHGNKRQLQKWPNRCTHKTQCVGSWHCKMSESIYLTIHSQLREPQKPQKLYNNHSTKLPLSLSLFLSLSSRLSSLVSIAGPKAKTVFFLSHFALPRRKTRSLSFCVSLFVHIVCYHNWEKKVRDLRLLWGTRLIHFFFSKAFLTGNGFWVFFVYTFCLLGSDSFLLVYCCCSWKSIVTKKSHKRHKLYLVCLIPLDLLLFFFFNWYGLVGLLWFNVFFIGFWFLHHDSVHEKGTRIRHTHNIMSCAIGFFV